MSTQMTPYKQLAQVKDHTGLQIRLRQFEEVIGVSCLENMANVLVTTYEIRETSRDLIFKRKGTKMMTWRRDDIAGWSYDLKMELIMWDDSYVSEIIVKSGRSNTPAEVRARRNFEKDCYRPGDSHSPLDSYGRVLDGASGETMSRYW